MLSTLKIQNFALIQDLQIEFQSGLDIITGETGAGKSIIIGALGLLLGNRADTHTLMNPEKKCVIEGRFHIGAYDLVKFFKENDLDWDEHTILRREINPGGKSRAFINDTPVNLDIMKEFGEFLVDIHSQHQARKISDPGFQIKFVDSVAGQKPLLARYQDLYQGYKQLAKELAALKHEEAQAKKESDYNNFQLNELAQANLKAGELQQLEEELYLLTHAENIKLILRTAVYDLHDEERSVNNLLYSIKKQLASVAASAPLLQQLAGRIENILIETKDIYREINLFEESVTVDAQRLDEVNERLQIINHLLNKHQFKTETELINYTDSLSQKNQSAQRLEEHIEAVEKQLTTLGGELETLAARLSQTRRSKVKSLQDTLIQSLKQLGIPDANILIDIQPSARLNENGKDDIAILFSANKGSRPAPVADVASGGELSRLSLCFKYIMAGSMVMPTIIFDEIDTGVSGEVGKKVGAMIKTISEGRQVLCITHLPQVAAMADHHYVVYKMSGKELSFTDIRQINNEERVAEIAQMIAGHKPSEIAIENARELLNF